MSPLRSLPAVSRRGFLGGTAGGLAAAALGSSLLSACSSSSGSGGPTGPKAVLPAHVPFQGPTPDLAADVAGGINPGYFQYPIDGLVKSVEGEVGAGGEMRAFVISFSPPPPTLSDNAYWQAINEALNVDFKPTLVPQDFATKLAATMTGGDVPDLVTMYLSDAAGLRRFNDLAAARFADLTDHLSGDNVKDYPNLARLPQEAWGATLVNGRIYGTPTLRIPTGSAAFYQPDVLAQYDVNTQPTSPEEFEEFCRSFSDPGKNRYAMAGASWMLLSLIHPMFGVPNDWAAAADGTLTKDWESEQYAESLAFAKRLWDAGYYHPDSASEGFDSEPFFENGSVALREDSVVRYTVRNDSKIKVAIMGPYLDGQPTGFQGPITDFVTFIKKADDERVKECLRVLNWLSAPFGSEENFLRTYGVEGKDHTIEDGVPTLTAQGEAETFSLCLRFIAGGPDVLFAATGDPSVVESIHEFQTTISPNRVLDPTDGLRSESEVQAADLELGVTDAATDYIVGRKDYSAVEDAVAKWKSEAGDKIREEYQQAIEEREKVS